MSDKNKYTAKRLADHTINCDICGRICWYSESYKLTVETGRGGCLVCKECNDPIDFGLVPFVIPAEKPVDETRLLAPFNDNTNITGTTPFNTGTTDPLSTN